MNLSSALVSFVLVPFVGACGSLPNAVSTAPKSTPSVVLLDVVPLSVEATDIAGGASRSVAVRARVDVRSNRFGDGIVGLPERIVVELRHAGAADGTRRVASTSIVTPSSIVAGGSMSVLTSTFDAVLDPDREYVIEAHVAPNGRTKRSAVFVPAKL